MINTILVPTDGSDHARKAVALASDLAEKYGATLILLHVLLRGRLPKGMERLAEAEHITEAEDPSQVFSGNIPAASSAVFRGPRTKPLSRQVYEIVGRQILENAEKSANERDIDEVRLLIEDGDPAQRILECAEREKADVIVMGSRGLSDLKGLLVGSVSHKVSELSPCTCIAVK